MTTMFRSEVACAHCGVSCETVQISSTNRFGSSDLDLRPPPMERDTLRVQIEHCPGCGFCAPNLSEAEGLQVELIGSPDYQAVLCDGNLPELARHFLAYSMLAGDAPDQRKSFWATLKAAWACDDAERDASAIRCREMSMSLMGLSHLSGGTVCDDRVTDEVLRIDLLRRSGKMDAAQLAAEKLLEGDAPEMVRKIAAFQATLASRGDPGCHSIDEVANI